MNFPSPVTMISKSPRGEDRSEPSGRVHASPASGRRRRLRASRAILATMSRDKKASSRDVDDELSKSGRGAPHALHNKLDAPIVDSGHCSDDDALDLPRGGVDDSHRTHITLSTLEDSLSSSTRDMFCSSSSPECNVAEMQHSRLSTIVTFGTVEIREYPRALGDNPAVTSGPPLTIDWSHDPSTAARMELDVYEADRPFPPREKRQMLMPRFVREGWLREAGYSRGEIATAVKEADAIKESRRRSSRGASLRKVNSLKELLMMRMSK